MSIKNESSQIYNDNLLNQSQAQDGVNENILLMSKKTFAEREL